MGRGDRCHSHEFTNATSGRDASHTQLKHELTSGVYSSSRGFTQSHIGERHLPPVAYKHEDTSWVYPPSLKNCTWCSLHGTPLLQPSAKGRGEGGGFLLNPRRRLFEDEYISPLEGIVCFGNGPRRQMPPAWICSIPHRGEMPPTHSL